MKIDGSGSIDPRHVELVKRVAEKFELGAVDKETKTNIRDNSVLLARVLQQFKEARADKIAETKEKLDRMAVSASAIARALLEKTKEDAET